MKGIEKAIKKAIEGGWDRRKYDGDTAVHSDGQYKTFTSNADILLSKSFWQALGKAEGWSDKKHWWGGTVNPENDYEELPINSMYEWEWHWLMFIHHLAQGKSIDDFFNKLLTP